jgi:hypothetical protein
VFILLDIFHLFSEVCASVQPKRRKKSKKQNAKCKQHIEPCVSGIEPSTHTQPIAITNTSITTNSNDDEHIPECNMCFLRPCVVTRPCSWLGPGQAACDSNSPIRKDKYTSYWRMIDYLGGWNDSRYLARKKREAGGGEWALQHMRQVMPVCVLKHVRGLYPNLPDRQYLGHKWD